MEIAPDAGRFSRDGRAIVSEPLNNLEAEWVQNVEFFTFRGTLFIFLTALVLLCWRGLTWRTWGTGVAAAAIWLANLYAPVPAWFGMLFALLAIGALFVTHRAERAFAKT